MAASASFKIVFPRRIDERTVESIGATHCNAPILISFQVRHWKP
jgi:hypothetical protein